MNLGDHIICTEYTNPLIRRIGNKVEHHIIARVSKNIIQPITIYIVSREISFQLNQIAWEKIISKTK